jgi:CRISPR-associated endonuclease/helicase Cas3
MKMGLILNNQYFSHKYDNKRLNKKFLTHINEVTETMLDNFNSDYVELTNVNNKDIKKIISIIGISHDFAKLFFTFQEYLDNPSKYSRKTFLKNHSFVSAIFAQLLTKEVLNDRNLAYVVYNVVINHHSDLKSIDIKNIKKQVRRKTPEQWKMGVTEEIEEDIMTIYKYLLKKYNLSADLKKIMFKLKNIVLHYNKRDIKEFQNDLEIHFSRSLNSDFESKMLEQFLIRYTHSLLTDYDSKSADNKINTDKEYFKENSIKTVSVEDYIKEQRKKYPKKFGLHKKINKIRTEHFNYVNKEVFQKGLVNDKYKIYSLKAPTGAGKTFATLEFANKINKLHKQEMKIIYTAPLTSTVNQNFEVTENIFKFNLKDKYRDYPERYLLKDHYLNEFKIKENSYTKDYADFQSSEMLLSSWGSSQVNTTLVKIFQIMFGTKKSFLKRFHNLSNSIVIIDEIQDVTPAFYIAFGKVADFLSKVFNCYFVFTTATMPILFENNEEEKVQNISYKPLEKHEYFNRVKLKNINKLEDINLDRVLHKLEKEVLKKGKKNSLSTFNTIKTAKMFGEKLKNLVNKKYKNYEVVLLETDITSANNNLKIDYIKNKLNNNEKILVVSTQIIETGVDVDFECGFREIAPIINIIQFAGRINRNNLMPKLADIYCFKLNSKISKTYFVYDYISLETTIKLLTESNKYIESKEFFELNDRYFDQINRKYNKENNDLLKALINCRFSEEKNSLKEIAKLIKNIHNFNLLILDKTAINDKVNVNLQKLIKLREELKAGLSRKDFYENQAKRKRLRKKLMKHEVKTTLNEKNRDKIIYELLQSHKLKAYPDRGNVIFFYFKKEDIKDWYNDFYGLNTDKIKEILK